MDCFYQANSFALIMPAVCFDKQDFLKSTNQLFIFLWTSICIIEIPPPKKKKRKVKGALMARTYFSV